MFEKKKKIKKVILSNLINSRLLITGNVCNNIVVLHKNKIIILVYRITLESKICIIIYVFEIEKKKIKRTILCVDGPLLWMGNLEGSI